MSFEEIKERIALEIDLIKSEWIKKYFKERFQFWIQWSFSEYLEDLVNDKFNIFISVLLWILLIIFYVNFNLYKEYKINLEDNYILESNLVIFQNAYKRVKKLENKFKDIIIPNVSVITLNDLVCLVNNFTKKLFVNWKCYVNSIKINEKNKTFQLSIDWIKHYNYLL